MALHYELKEGHYHLYDLSTPTRRLRLTTDHVAIAFDRRTGQLHEHGSPWRIHSWATTARRRLRAAGSHDSANDIVVVSGPLPVEELNKCLRINGYCRSLFTRLAHLPHGKRLARDTAAQ